MKHKKQPISYSILMALLAFLCPYLGIAQQLPLFTQHQAFQGIINPAALSTEYLLEESTTTISLSSRTQWSALEGGPRTNLLEGSHVLLSNKASLLVGGYMLQDKIGPTAVTGVYGKLAGILSDGDPYFGGVVLGLSAGFAQFKIDAQTIEVTAPNDPLVAMNQQQLYPDVGVGVFVYRQLDGGGFLDGDKAYFGLSVPQILGLDVSFKNIEGQYALERIPHYFGQIGLHKFLANDNIWSPSIWVKYAEGVPVQIDLNSRFQWNHHFWMGIGFSNNNILHLETGVIVGEGLKIGYGYDHSFTGFGPFTGATHEVNLRIVMGR